MARMNRASALAQAIEAGEKYLADLRAALLVAQIEEAQDAHPTPRLRLVVDNTPDNRGV